MREDKFATAAIVAVSLYLGMALVYAAVTGASVPLISAPLAPIIAVLIAAIAAIWRLRPTYRVNLALAAFTTLLALMAAEVALAVARDDDRSELEVVRDLRGEGVDAYPPVVPKQFMDTGLMMDGEEVFPLAGVAGRTTVYCREAGGMVLYRADEHGFHNPPELWAQGAINVAVIGDSYTKGGCVESDKNAVALIREVHPSTLNLGMGGSGPVLELATVKEYLGDLEPRTVLWFYYEGNDVGNLGLEMRRYPLYDRYLNHNYRQDLRIKQEEVSQALAAFAMRGLEVAQDVREPRSVMGRALDRLLLRETAARIESLAADRESGEGPEQPGNCVYDHDWTSELRALKRVLADADVFVSSWGGEMRFVYLPAWSRYAPDTAPCLSSEASLKEASLRGLRGEVLAITGDLGIPTIDAQAAFDGHADVLSLFAFRDQPGHYNEAGYRLLAETVLSAMGAEKQQATPPEGLRDHVVNGSFEAGDGAEWTEDIDGSLDAITEPSPAEALRGDASMKIDVASSKALGIARRFQEVPVIPGEVWSVAAWVNVVRLSDASVRLRLRWLGAYDDFLTQETVTDGWVHLKIQDRRVPAGVTTLRIQLGIRANLGEPGGGGGTAYFDDVVAVKSPRAPSQ